MMIMMRINLERLHWRGKDSDAKEGKMMQDVNVDCATSWGHILGEGIVWGCRMPTDIKLHVLQASRFCCILPPTAHFTLHSTLKFPANYIRTRRNAWHATATVQLNIPIRKKSIIVRS